MLFPVVKLIVLLSISLSVTCSSLRPSTLSRRNKIVSKTKAFVAKKTKPRKRRKSLSKKKSFLHQENAGSSSSSNTMEISKSAELNFGQCSFTNKNYQMPVVITSGFDNTQALVIANDVKRAMKVSKTIYELMSSKLFQRRQSSWIDEIFELFFSRRDRNAVAKRFLRLTQPGTVAILQTKNHGDAIAASLPKHAVPKKSDPFILLNRDGSYFNILKHDKQQRAATVLHELSHYIEGTKDVAVNGKKAYGFQAATDLLKHDPKLAYQNADNYAEFAVMVMYKLNSLSTSKSETKTNWKVDCTKGFKPPKGKDPNRYSTA